MASRPSPLVSSILRQLRTHTRRAAPLRLPLNRPVPAALWKPISIRAAHSIPRPKTAWDPPASKDTSDDVAGEGKRPEPRHDYYQLSFTCVPCGFRSHHNVSKQGYHKGSTLITCPDCRNRHVISDHLNIFGDKKFTIEDLMREKGQLVKRGSLGEDGDIEFWPDEQHDEQEAAPGKGEVPTNGEIP
ncbi:hypothetical protein G7046_g4618 [Stylonectria norvegica]|nr:hypothetical protein G7046_g4618 [Stylonectria norvegica]